MTGSGLIQRAFCQREGLAYSSFDYWRRRIGSAAVSTKARQPRKLTLVAAVPTPKTDTHLQSAIPPATDIIYLRSPGGRQIQLSICAAGTAMAHLTHLIQHLP